MKLLKPLVCASALLVLSACSENESAQSLITKAENFIVEEQNDSAIISLKNALKIDAKNAHARFLLGRIYLSTGNAVNAVNELERASKLKYSADKVIPLLPRAYILTESDSDVLELIEKEKMLLHQSKMASMGEMLGNIAHQWRQPLSSVSTAASGILLQKEIGQLTDNHLEHSLKAIVKNTKLLSQTIDDFRNFYKTDKNKNSFKPEKIINKVLLLIDANLKNKGIKAFIWDFFGKFFSKKICVNSISFSLFGNSFNLFFVSIPKSIPK